MKFYVLQNSKYTNLGYSHLEGSSVVQFKTEN
jgi:hypothetical protein